LKSTGVVLHRNIVLMMEAVRTSSTSVNIYATNQPTNEKALWGGSLGHAQDIVSCKVTPFLRTTRTAGNYKRCLVNYNLHMLTLTGLLTWLKPLTRLDWGLLLLVGGRRIRQFVLYERNFGLGNQPRRVGIALADGLCDMG
jgi:hypothetical protein